MPDISQAIGIALTADTTSGSLYSMVNGQIFMLRAPEQEPPILPCVVFNVIDDPNERTFLKDRVAAVVQIDVYADIRNGASTPAAINSKIEILLNRVPLTITGHPGAQSLLKKRGIKLEVPQDINGIRIMSKFDIVAS